MTKKIQYVDYACEIGDRVRWANLRGQKFEGILEDWNSNIAIIKLDDGSIMEVEC